MSTLKVSITPQLRELLGPLEGLLPPELNALVVDTLATSTEIRYSLVVDVSKWAFSDEGKIKLEEKGLSEFLFSKHPVHCHPFLFFILFLWYSTLTFEISLFLF